MWLNMDRANNLFVIDGVMWFEEPIDWERLCALIQRRLIACYLVFSQRPVSPFISFGTPHWQDDPDFGLRAAPATGLLTGTRGSGGATALR